MSVTVTPVSGRRELDAFIKLPFNLYRNDPHWVPPLLFRERQRFDPKTNPFLQHADAQLFLAHHDGQTVGRISAQVDHEHNRFHEERTGFFGFFESEDDPEPHSAAFRRGRSVAARAWHGGRPRSGTGAGRAESRALSHILDRSGRSQEWQRPQMPSSVGFSSLSSIRRARSSSRWSWVGR